MATDLKISQLTEYTTPVDTDLLAIVDTANGITKKVDFSVVKSTIGVTRYKQTEIDFGTTPVYEASFTITDSEVTTSSIIVAQIAYVAPTGKELDELEFDFFDFRCTPGTGSFTLYARSLEGLVADKFKINYSYNIA
jgi:hypothetical protein